MKAITSIHNPLIKECQKLRLRKYRRKEKRFLVEGQNLIAEAARSGCLEVVLTTEPTKKGILVSSALMTKLATTKTPVTAIGICKIQPARISGNRVLALDNIQDPGNVGTLIRTAQAFGWNGIFVKGVDLYNPKLLRATQGALFGISIVQTDSLSQHFGDYQVIVATSRNNVPDVKAFSDLMPLPDRLMLVLGNEGHGVTPVVMKRAHYRVTIPVQFESLNVAQAGAILLHAYRN